jgi:hypothetical protein
VAIPEPDTTWQLRCHFISYRWETTEHAKWVRALADGLIARGYPVILDQYYMERQDLPATRFDQLLNLLPRLADVTHFTPVLTRGYRERLLLHDAQDADWRDGWLYDEWTIAVNRAVEGDLVFDGVWRSGDGVPSPFTTDNVADFRGDDLKDALDHWYPPYEVHVIGERADGTAGLVGPVLYTEYLTVLDMFHRDNETFQSVKVVPLER